VLIDMPANAKDAPRYWFDVDDLLIHFKRWPNVTGIQRVGKEIIREVLSQAPERIGLVRIAKVAGRFEPLAVIPPYLSTHLDIGRSRTSIPKKMLAGDFLIEIGAAWPHWHFARSARKAKRQGLKLAIMAHDLLPLTHPQFFSRHDAAAFAKGLERLEGTIDMILVSSRDVAGQLQRYFANRRWPTPPVERIPFGAGFSFPPSAAPIRLWEGPYVLFVSTLEVRKNHLLMVRVWERLIATHGTDAIPQLVFVGRKGWLVEELLNDLKRTQFLSNKIIWRSNLDDADLSAAYDHCLFTVYPSLGEGWGLPVTESLKHGKFSVSSNRNSLPEAGGSYVDYFDPDDFDDAYRKIERPLFEGNYLERRTAEITNGFVAPTWTDTARALLQALDRATST
jgi:glycosyltransferase involved in cell wall biosynthesis